MLLNLLRQGFSGDAHSFFMIALLVPIVFISLTVHECAHGYIAYKLGDPTAKAMGRLSLDPRAHLDPVGALMLFVFGYGWAKPVPINPNYFKNRKVGMALTALAGPVSNLLMAFAALLILRLLVVFFGLQFGLSLVYEFLGSFAVLNISLAIFNLIPVPPLDGSRILNIVLPERYYFKVMQYERYIYLAIILLLFTGRLSVPLSYLNSRVLYGMNLLISLIPGL